MIPCFCNLNLDIFPFKHSLEKLMSKKWGENQMSRYHGVDDLNPELIQFFKSNDVKLINQWLLIYWWDDKEAPIHTDGNNDRSWVTNGNLVKRECGINWNFTPGTWVEFYDSENLTPYKRNQDLANIFYSGEPKVIDKWDSMGPVIINPQIPHTVRGTKNFRRRMACTLSFNETFESIISKLQKFIIQ
jgi:hypothetical protein